MKQYTIFIGSVCFSNPPKSGVHSPKPGSSPIYLSLWSNFPEETWLCSTWSNRFRVTGRNHWSHHLRNRFDRNVHPFWGSPYNYHPLYLMILVLQMFGGHLGHPCPSSYGEITSRSPSIRSGFVNISLKWCPILFSSTISPMNHVLASLAITTEYPYFLR